MTGSTQKSSAVGCGQKAGLGASNSTDRAVSEIDKVALGVIISTDCKVALGGIVSTDCAVSEMDKVARGAILSTDCAGSEVDKVARDVIISTDCAVPEIVGTAVAAGRQLTRVMSMKRKSGITTIILDKRFMLWKSIQ